MSNRRGFTLVEIMVSLLVFAFIMGAVLTMFFQGNKVKEITKQLVEAQQNARNGIDFMTKDLRAAGYDVDVSTDSLSSQRAIVYAAPFEIVFNGNLLPAEDVPENPREPKAINPSLSPKPTHYSPTKYFQTGAETYVYTLDINGDGQIDAADRNTGPAANTPDPNDYTLVRRVYGVNDDGTNGGDVEWIAIVKGPLSDNDTLQPIFAYWYNDDDDLSTPDLLWGDTNHDGELDASERASLIPINSQPIMDKITRVDIILTALTPDKDDDTGVPVKTSVFVDRNAPVKLYTVSFHVYHEMDDPSDTAGYGHYDAVDEEGLPGFNFALTSGEFSQSDGTGVAEFSLPPGEYSVAVTAPVGWMPTTSTTMDFTVVNSDLNFTSNDQFGMREWPTGFIKGKIWLDTIANGVRDTGEPIMTGIDIIGGEGETEWEDTLFSKEVNALVMHVFSPDMGDTFRIMYSHIDTIDSPGLIEGDRLSDGSLAIRIAEDDTVVVEFGIAPIIGEPCNVTMTKPQNNAIIYEGRWQTCEWIASAGPDSPDSIDGDRVVNFKLKISIDNGNTWIDVAEKNNVYGEEPWEDGLDWTPDTSIGYCPYGLLLGEVYDQGGYHAYDTVHVTFVPRGGIKQFYLWRDVLPDTILEEDNSTKYVMSLQPQIHIPPKYGNAASDSFYTLIGYDGPLYFNIDEDYTADFMTPKGLPGADTLYAGSWVFIFYGAGMYDDIDHTVNVEVSLRDSTGEDEKGIIFDTRDPSNYGITIVKQTPLSTAVGPCTLIVNTNNPMAIENTDRLYLKLFGKTTTGGSRWTRSFMNVLYDSLPSYMMLPSPSTQ